MIAIKPEHDNFHFETRKLKQKGIVLYLYSGLEKSMNYIVHRIAKNWTQLSDFHFTWLGCPTVIVWYLLVIWTYTCTVTHIPLCVIYRDLHVWWRLAVEKGMATLSSILAWRIPWTEKPGGLQSMGSQRVGHDWSDLAHIHGGLQMALSAISSSSSS